MKVILKCDFCGGELRRYPSQIKKFNFCCRRCLADFSSKSKNPSGYTRLKDFSNTSKNMSQLNLTLNPMRMNPKMKEKLRNSRLGKGRGTSYEKTYGRHTHRVVAEMMLGRPLQQGEVVHHIDGNRRNNKPENLKVYASQSEHIEMHRLWDKLIQNYINRGGDADEL